MTPTPDKPHGDRSGTLFKFAVAMVRQGYSDATMMTELRHADIEWGRKYADRPDTDHQLQVTIQNARRLV